MFANNILKAGKCITVLSLLSSLWACGGSSDSPPVNKAPLISGSPIVIKQVGENYHFSPTASDPEGETLIFSIENKPEWAEFDTTTGTLSSASVEVGITEKITISVSDGELSSSLPSFSISVSELGQRFISVRISGSSPVHDFQILLNEDESDEQQLTVKGDGDFNFATPLNDQQTYKLSIQRDPARQACEINEESGTVDGAVNAIEINCSDDESAELFDINKLHHFRITMSLQEWQAFVLDTDRANYTNSDANGHGSWNLWTHSEVYRKVNMQRLNDSGEIIDNLDNVAFKMRGNTSRQWPEFWYDQGDGNWAGHPSRFHFSLKFDEKFDDDESVYACIDANGDPAAVSTNACYNRVALNHPEVPTNDDRSLKGVEKLYFKFNKDDPSYARELLSHDILNQVGVPTSRMAYAAVEFLITGQAEEMLFNKPLPQSYNMGVYMMEEPIDKPYLKRYFGKNGFLFKISGGDLAQYVNQDCLPYEEDNKVETGYINNDFCNIGVEQSDPESREQWLGTNNYLDPAIVNSEINGTGNTSQFAPYRPTYDLKEKKKSLTDARLALQEFMLFVQSNPSADLLAEQFNVEGFIKAQAVDIVIGGVDHYARVANNYYLYFNPLTEKWNYLVYDYDFSFRDKHPDNWGSDVLPFQNITDSAIFTSDGKTAWNEERIEGVDPILWDLIFADNNNREILYQEVQSLLTEQLDWDETLKTVLQDRNNLIKNSILSSDVTFNGDCNVQYMEGALGLSSTFHPCDSGDISIKEYINRRQRSLTEELQAAGY